MFYHSSFSPLVKQKVIISNERDACRVAERLKIQEPS